MIDLAEAVLPGHPDKLCDGIADRLVDAAIARHPRALVGVEVAIHRDTVLVTGCITTAPPLTLDDVEAIVRGVLAGAGYGPDWPPDPSAVRVLMDLRLEALDDALAELRSVSDDQAITLGWAGGRAASRWLPEAHRLAWRLAVLLDERRAGLGLGPDGKVVVGLPAVGPPRVSFSMHHRPGVDRTALYGLADTVIKAAGLVGVTPEVNGGGDFDVGGSMGDNGLSGKKLVVDAYGPGVPIGGGAWSGKDPHKVDRLGAIRARQLARLAVERGLGREALVRFGWFPGDRAPSLVDLLLDGCPADLRLLGPVDLTIDGTVRELGLTRVRYAPRAARASWFQEPAPWEGRDAVAARRLEG